MLILDDYSKGQRLLKELFIKIQTNYKNYSKEELHEIEKFLKDEIIVKNTDDTFELNSKYKVALVKVGKNLVVLEDLISEHKNIKIEFDDLNGAYDGDLVLAKRVFNPRSKTKAKIVKILDGKKNEVLVYIKDKAFYTVKENIKLENKNALKYQDGDVLLVENKSLELIKNLGNIENPKIDELISLHLYNEIFRLEKHLEVTANMDDTKQRVDLRDLYFYCEDGTDPEHIINEVMQFYPEYRYRFDQKLDSDWSTYFNYMYPSKEIMQTISNRSVIENLQNHGDNLEVARAIDHWIYFKNEVDLHKFVEIILSWDFQINQRNKIEEYDGFPYQLQISKTEFVDQQSIDHCTLQLSQLANQLNGEYDGWETVVIKK